MVVGGVKIQKLSNLEEVLITIDNLNCGQGAGCDGKLTVGGARNRQRVDMTYGAIL